MISITSSPGSDSKAIILAIVVESTHGQHRTTVYIPGLRLVLTCTGPKKNIISILVQDSVKRMTVTFKLTMWRAIEEQGQSYGGRRKAFVAQK